VSDATSYIIATSPRTGGWLLCEALSRLEIAGRPGEYGAREEPALWKNLYGFSDHEAYFRALHSIYATPNGVAGIKLMWYQFAELGRDGRRYFDCPDSAIDITRRLLGPFRVIRLQRRNRLRQAISLVRAHWSGIWSSAGPPPKNRPGEVYDSGRIATAMAAIKRQDDSWESALMLFEAEVFRVVYEDLAADYTVWTGAAARFLGLDPDMSRLPAKPFVQRQADEVTEEWVARAKKDLDPALLEMAPVVP
jgi:LPS sulfotransferase NodH